MLLLPLLVLWAHAPMKFPKYMMRSLTVLVVLIAILSPVCLQNKASGAEGDLPDNRLRSDKMLAAADGNANQMRPAKMREGTLVPQTVGRFVPAGRRWMFIPESVVDATNDVVMANPDHTHPSRGIFQPVSASLHATPSGQSPFAFTEDGTIQNPLRSSLTGGEAAAPDHILVGQPEAMLPGPAPDPDPDPNNPIELSRVVVAENLMLQRIVEAIRIDGADDRWTVSGRLTEYFDENRLQLQTAERATSK